MECPVCYTSQAKCKLFCGHSFCYQCIVHWYQECGNHTCPVCRTEINFFIPGNTSEIYIHCTPNSKIDDYVKFQHLLDKYTGFKIKDVEYLRRQPWVQYVIERRAEKQLYTKYIFHGLQGAQEACHQKRQEEQKTSIFPKAYKD